MNCSKEPEIVLILNLLLIKISFVSSLSDVLGHLEHAAQLLSSMIWNTSFGLWILKHSQHLFHHREVHPSCFMYQLQVVFSNNYPFTNIFVIHFWQYMLESTHSHWGRNCNTLKWLMHSNLEGGCLRFPVAINLPGQIISCLHIFGGEKDIPWTSDDENDT